jgi:cell division septation protein DedD
MSTTSNGFLTKSVIVLALFLVSMGVSLFLGKMLGRNIMTMAKSNIQSRFSGNGDKNGSGDQGALANSLGGSRSDFGFNSGEFAPDEAPRSTGPGEKMNFSTVAPEPDVDIILLNEKPEDATADAEKPADGSGDTATKPDETKKTEEKNPDGSIFKLSDKKTFHIQVGTFSTEENAQSVWKRLTQAGYDAHMTSFNDATGDHFKVTVGTYHKREEADTTAEALRKMNFDAWVFEEK